MAAPATTGAKVREWKAGFVFQLAFHPRDGRVAVTAGNRVRLFDADTGREPPPLDQGHEVHTVAWHPDGRRLATGCDDRRIRIWDAAAAVHPGGGAVDEALARPAQAGGVEALFASVGLEDVDGGVVEVPMRFESFDDYWVPFLDGVGPGGDFVRALDAEGREALRTELQRRLGTGAIEMTSTARWVRGTVPD